MDKKLEQRFWSHVAKKSPSECWLWTGSCFVDGYGMITKAIGCKTARAHRVSWYLANGRMPERSECVCHKCDVRNCVNPAHLFLGSHEDNMRDAVSKGRMDSGESKSRKIRGERNGNALLTDDQVREIKRLLIGVGPNKWARKAQAYARSLGLKHAVADIRRGSWNHIT